MPFSLLSVCDRLEFDLIIIRQTVQRIGRVSLLDGFVGCCVLPVMRAGQASQAAGGNVSKSQAG